MMIDMTIYIYIFLLCASFVVLHPQGEFSEDKIHGVGTLTYANGNVYEGEFLNDKSHGVGTFSCECGPWGFLLFCSVALLYPCLPVRLPAIPPITAKNGAPPFQRAWNE